MGGSNSCLSGQHLDGKAVGGQGKFGQGSDIDAAALAATNFGGVGGLSQKVNISFGCHSLPNMDTFSESDPFCILYKQTGRVWTKLGQTEVIHDNLNPQFVTKVPAEYHFEQQEKFKVEVYDVDDDTQINNLKAHDFIGRLEFELHEIITARDQKLTRPLVGGPAGSKGTISLIAEEQVANANAEMIMFTPEATISSTSDQNFFIMYKCMGPNSYVPVYKSEIKRAVKGNLFRWNHVQIGATDLCKDNIENEIKFEFFKSVTSGKHKIVGTVKNVTLAMLKAGEVRYNFEKNKNDNLQMQALKIERRHTFLEYIFGGCDIELSLAIDFTLSNGAVNDPRSLHYPDPKRNQYLQVIQSVGNILQYYNSSKMINLYGFGGALP